MTHAELPPVIRIGTGIVYSLLCVDDSLTDDEAATRWSDLELEAGKAELAAAGIEIELPYTHWRPSIEEDMPAEHRALVRVCPDVDTRRHIVVHC